MTEQKTFTDSDSDKEGAGPNQMGASPSLGGPESCSHGIRHNLSPG